MSHRPSGLGVGGFRRQRRLRSSTRSGAVARVARRGGGIQRAECTLFEMRSVALAPDENALRAARERRRSCSERPRQLNPLGLGG